MKGKEKELFEKTPVFEAVLKLVLPTVMGQIILVVYNMADTFFIGLTGSDMLITSVTISMPAFMFLSAISNPQSPFVKIIFKEENKIKFIQFIYNISY